MSSDHPPAERMPSLISRALPDAATRAGVIVSLVLLLISFISLIWTPHPLDQSGVAAQLLDPSFEHLLGTDAAGRDVASLVMRGLLTSYVVAGIGVAIGLMAGVPLGLAAAFFGVPNPLGRVAGDALTAIPSIAIAAMLATLSEPGPINAMAAVGFASVPLFAAVTGAVARDLLGRDYVAAARLAGLGAFDAAARHVIPALGPVLLAQALMQLGLAIIAEAALSYAGLSARPGGASLGLMLREALSYLLFEPMLVIVPGLAVALAAGALQLTAHGLRSRSDARPRTAEHDDALA